MALNSVEKKPVPKRIFVLLLFYLILGILIGSMVPWSRELQYVGFVLLICLFIIVLFGGNRIPSNLNFGFLIVLWVLVAALIMSIQMPKKHETQVREGQFLAEVVSTVKETNKQVRAQLQVKQVIAGQEEIRSNLAVLGIFWKSEGRLVNLRNGDRIQFQGKLKALPAAYNPRQFDFAGFMKAKGVYYEIQGQLEDVQIIPQEETWHYFRWAQQSQVQLAKKFQEYIPNQVAYQLASAIVFGYRPDFPEEVLNVFSNTGTIHVLSVSGMHVMLVFGLLMYIFRFMNRLPGLQSIQYILVLLIIWFYSSICGFAPPILRASLMISFFIIGRWSQQQIFSINILAASAFFILIFNPHMLFDIGFQLSYSAVLGIMLLSPMWRAYWVKRNWYSAWLYDLIIISVAAQVFTTPLALYYFHQFPVYFLVANLLISIPSSLLMYLGAILMISSNVFVNFWTGFGLQELLLITYRVLKWLDSWPLAVIRMEFFHFSLVFCSYFAIMMLLLAIYHRGKAYLIWGLSSMLLILCYLLYERLEHRNYSGLKIYNVQRDVAIGYFQSGKLLLFSNLDSLRDRKLKYTIQSDLNRYAEPSSQTFIPLKLGYPQGIQIRLEPKLWLQTSAQPDRSKVDFYLLRNNQPYSLKTKAGLVVLDGSNSWAYIQQTRRLLDSLKQPCYVLKENFAYVWDR